jgi:hypothetical protein
MFAFGAGGKVGPTISPLADRSEPANFQKITRVSQRKTGPYSLEGPENGHPKPKNKTSD